MEQALIKSVAKEDLNIISFGRETNSKNACWGRGCRNVVLVHYVFSGEGYFNDVKVHTGEGFFIRANESHEYHSSTALPWSYFWVALEGEEAEKKCLKHICVNENGIFKYSFLPELCALADTVLHQEGGMDSLLALSYFFRLLSLHERNEKHTHSANGYVSAAKEYIKNNFHRAISITEIADAVFVNDRYLYNLFIKYEGMSPKKYLNKVRLDYACRLLKSREYTIAEIAESVGFSDVFYFSHFFSVNMKISPSEYRKER